MKGFPQHINTKQDVINLAADYPEQGKRALETLIAEIHIWQRGEQLEDGDDGVSDDTHRVDIVVERADQDDSDNDQAQEQTLRYQSELIEDMGCGLYRLGMTEAEALTIIAGGI